MQTQNQTSEQSSKSHTLAGLRFGDIIQTLGVAIAVALFLKIFIIELYQVPSRSMEQKLLAGDYVIADKIAYSIGLPTVLPFTNIRLPFAEWRIMFKSIHRGDVIIFDFPGEISEIIPKNPELYVKRVVGLPGETISVNEGKVFVNGSPIDYCDVTTTTAPPPMADTEDCAFLGPLIVPKKGMKLTLTPEYIDLYQLLIEREGNTMEIENNRIYINGEETTSYTVQDNYYYVLGDNCSDSYDSRFWGFVPERSIMGKPLMVYWSVDAVSRSARWNRIGTIVR
ncbi:MAG: signal peptidase I [Bacteroidetes bacterium]|nr:signal peptidase I [Bacteroidota bacterium]